MPNIFDNAEKKYMEDRVRGILWKKLAMIKTEIFAATKKKLRPTKWKTIYLHLFLSLLDRFAALEIWMFFWNKKCEIFFSTHISLTHSLSLSLFHTHFSSTGLVHRCSTWSAGDTNYRTSSSWIPSNSSTRSNARNSGFVAFLPNPFWTVSKNEDPRPIGKSLQTIEFEKVKKTGKMLRTVTKMDLSLYVVVDVLLTNFTELLLC